MFGTAGSENVVVELERDVTTDEFTLISRTTHEPVFSLKSEEDGDILAGAFKRPVLGYDTNAFEKFTPNLAAGAKNAVKEQLVQELAVITTAFSICISRKLWTESRWVSFNSLSVDLLHMRLEGLPRALRNSSGKSLILELRVQPTLDRPSVRPRSLKQLHCFSTLYRLMIPESIITYPTSLTTLRKPMTIPYMGCIPLERYQGAYGCASKSGLTKYMGFIWETKSSNGPTWMS